MDSSDITGIVALFILGVILVAQFWPPRPAPTAPRGCMFCGDTVVSSRTVCIECCQREKRHRTLLEHEARLRIQLLEQQIAEQGTGAPHGR
jgi:hypothetical protein